MSFASRFARKFRNQPAAAAASGFEEDSTLLLQEADAADSVSAADTRPHAAAAGSSRADGKRKKDRRKAPPPETGTDAFVRMPLLGYATADTHRTRLLLLTLVLMAAFIVLGTFSLWQFDQSRRQLNTAVQALMQSQRLAKAVSQTLTLGKAAFVEVNTSMDELRREINSLVAGDKEAGMHALGAGYAQEIETLGSVREELEKAVQYVAAQLQTVTDVDGSVAAISGLGAQMLEAARTVFTLRQATGAGSEEMQAAAHLLVLTQRVPVLALSVEDFDGVHDDTARLLRQEVAALGAVIQTLLDTAATPAAAARQPNAAQAAQLRSALQSLVEPWRQMRRHTDTIVGHVDTLKLLRQTRFQVNSMADAINAPLNAIQQRLQAGGMSVARAGSLALLLGLSILGGLGMVRVQTLENQRREQLALRQGEEIRLREQEAKRINDANQVAILRLMNEMQAVAEGDLTQQATVTEDITGAIADSVNYTVEELRALVGNVQSTVARVTQTTAQVDNTSSELLTASTEQLREIRETGRAVLEMAERITKVSGQAQQSAQVASQSLQAAGSGLKAVQDTIGGMNAIRDQIQETSKRIKRLGESSQEIGEITELISDITEQTNVLALNAAIQAASAGDAGRGFSVVAEEVQRLAERSAEATRRIAGLVKTIQGDTQDTMAAMERSTQGVVEGARLSDSAGVALREIDAVTQQLADLISQISQTTQHEAELAGSVAHNIQNIFTVTEQTGEGTRNTARLVRELTRMAEELRQSVDRFRIA